MFSEKPIVAFTNSTVFMLDFYTKPLVSCFILALSAWTLKKADIVSRQDASEQITKLISACKKNSSGIYTFHTLCRIAQA